MEVARFYNKTLFIEWALVKQFGFGGHGFANPAYSSWGLESLIILFLNLLK